MGTVVTCRVCGREESLAEPLIDGTCSDCLRKASGIRPSAKKAPQSPPVPAKPPLPPSLPHSVQASGTAIPAATADRKSGGNGVAQVAISTVAALGIWACALLLAAQLLGDEKHSWEYMVIAPPDSVLEEVFAILGRDRWELVTARRATAPDEASRRVAYECIFRRRTNMPPASEELRSAVSEYIRLDNLWQRRMAGDTEANKSPVEAHLRLIDEAVDRIIDARAKE